MPSVPSEQSPLATLLLHRIDTAKGNGRLATLLAEIKVRSGASIRTTGTHAVLADSFLGALGKQLTSIEELAGLVESTEETGFQHIILFRRTDSAPAIDEATILEAFTAPPSTPTEAYFRAIPTQNRFYAYKRNDRIFIKQIRSVTFFKNEPTANRSDGDLSFVARRKVQARSVNLFAVDPSTGEAEIRIDRVHSGHDSQVLAETQFKQFVSAINDSTGILDHYEPLSIQDHFNKIVNEIDGTFMTHDFATDATTKLMMMRRRDSPNSDIRQDTRHVMTGPQYARKRVPIYWELPADLGGGRVHTLLSREKWHGEDEVGKIYVAARVQPAELDHVIARLRAVAK